MHFYDNKVAGLKIIPHETVKGELKNNRLNNVFNLIEKSAELEINLKNLSDKQKEKILIKHLEEIKRFNIAIFKGIFPQISLKSHGNLPSVTVDNISNWKTILDTIKNQKNTNKLASKLLESKLKVDNRFNRLRENKEDELNDVMKDDIVVALNAIKDNLTLYYDIKDDISHEPSINLSSETQNRLYRIKNIFDNSSKLIKGCDYTNSQKENIKRFNIAILQTLFPKFLSKRNSMNFFKDNCLIVGNDEYIDNASISLRGKTYWNHELAHVAKYIYKKENYTIQIPYLKGLPHDPSLLGPLVYGLKGKDDLDKKTKINQGNEHMRDQGPYRKVNPKFFEKKPDIIVITSDSHEDVNRTLYELNNIIKKICYKA